MMMRLPAVSGLCTTRHRPLRLVPSLVPSKFALSLMLHCWRGSVVVPHGWSRASVPAPCGGATSTHMPSGIEELRDADSEIVRFWLYTQICARLFASQGWTRRLALATGALVVASRHRSS